MYIIIGVKLGKSSNPEKVQDPPEGVTRRDFLKLTAATVIGVAVGAGIGYAAKPSVKEIITETMTKTTTETVTETVTVTQKPQLPEKVWLFIDPDKCSGCRRCEIACSIHHEGKIWPEASRIRVFMFGPGLDFPVVCRYCKDHPCVEACPTGALYVDDKTSAIMIHKDKCIKCYKCHEACPGRIPTFHPTEGYALICDLCGGDPECAKVCIEGAIQVKPNTSMDTYKLLADEPEEIAKDLADKFFGKYSEKHLVI